MEKDALGSETADVELQPILQNDLWHSIPGYGLCEKGANWCFFWVVTRSELDFWSQGRYQGGWRVGMSPCGPFSSVLCLAKDVPAVQYLD